MRKGIKNRGRMISASDILGISDGTKFAAGGGAPPPPPPPTGLRQNWENLIFISIVLTQPPHHHNYQPHSRQIVWIKTHQTPSGSPEMWKQAIKINRKQIVYLEFGPTFPGASPNFSTANHTSALTLFNSEQSWMISIFQMTRMQCSAHTQGSPGNSFSGKSQLLSEHSTGWPGQAKGQTDQHRTTGSWGGCLVEHWSACESGQCGTLFACRTLQAPMHNVIQLAGVASGVVGNKCRCKTGATGGRGGCVVCETWIKAAILSITTFLTLDDIPKFELFFAGNSTGW